MGKKSKKYIETMKIGEWKNPKLNQKKNVNAQKIPEEDNISAVS